MTMAVAIASETRACRVCGVDVVHENILHLGGRADGVEQWSAREHTAPCGLPCFGARIMDREVLRAARAPGVQLRDLVHTAAECPRCRTRAEIIAARIDRIGADIRGGVRAEVEHDEEMEAMHDDIEDEEDVPPPAATLRPRPASIVERCETFDRAHPEVYTELRRLALEAVRRGRRRLAIAQLVEVARWNLNTDARDAEGFKVNNTFRAVWARRLMADEPELAGVFETRDLRAHQEDP